MTQMNEDNGFTFYDEGWNAAHDGHAFNVSAARDWRDGWKDYQSAEPSHQIRLDDDIAASALTLSTDLEPASHQVRAAFGSASLKG
jgi:hypothetical protein